MGPDTPLSVNSVLKVAVGGVLLPRRIRHISCMQVCNFTPFPVRDAVASALSQPVEPSQLNALSHLSDDLEILSRKRSRKSSATSTSTKASGRQDDDDTNHLPLQPPRGRKISHSRRSLTSGSSGVTVGPPDISRTPYGSPQTVRRRGRTNSVASSISGQAKTSSFFSQRAAVPSFSMVVPDISQRGLEKVIDSRLIETFLTITILPIEDPMPARSLPTNASPFSHRPDNQKSTSVRRKQTASMSSLPAGIVSKDKATSGMARPLPSTRLKASHSRSSSSPICQPDGETPSSSSNLTVQLPPISAPPNIVPDYFSQIHRPSVNPTFSIDAQPGHDFSSDSNMSSSRMTVQLWGRTKGASAKAAGKQKQKSVQDLIANEDSDWSVIQEWVVSLDELLPLPQHVSSSAADLPSNTLLVTLSPPGKTYYLPSLQLPSPHSPPSPTPGYSSEPEITPKKANRDGHVFGDSASTQLAGLAVGELASPCVQHRRSSGGTNTPAKGSVRTAAYQQLFELVNLQSLIQDHENMLSDLIRSIDKHFEDDRLFPLRREISECRHRLDALCIGSKTLVEETAARKKELEQRRQRLKERRQCLVSARILEETNISDSADLSQEAEEAREELTGLRAKFAPIRVGLLSTLASIYPIELDSPPDLLYTILNVPLPIPLTATDPAPPLSLPDHPNVNEDAIGTALGYVAQLLHLLAAYLSKTLIYPVTCVGSRSFIRDGISAMVGPRMFPLFSKGVDTYRFEYGVFLLNKDIEMLMSDRELRALDMRHTLPNLKNLVLTVTHGELAPVNHKAPLDSPVLSMLGLDSPTEEAPTRDMGSVTPKGRTLDLELPPDEASTPPASGSTTPTATALDEKKPRPFLGLSFSDFLRGRYPSTSRAPVKGVPGSLDGGRSQADVSGSNESGGSEAPEAQGDHVGNDVKPFTGELEQVPNRNRHAAGGVGNEGGVEDKVGEAVGESETISVHVH